MRIEKLHIENFRLFENLEITFPRSNVAVLIGENGAGKSTVLDALGIVLAKAVALISENGYQNGIPIKLFNPFDISLDKEKSTIQGDFFSTAEFMRSKHFFVSGEYSYPYEKWSDTYDSRPKSGVAILERKENIPVISYFMSSELKFQETQQFFNQIGKLVDDQFNAYIGSFNSVSLIFQKFFEWYKAEEDYENQLKLDHKDLEFVSPTLEVVRNAIYVFFNTLPSEKYENLRISRSKNRRPFNYDTSQFTNRLIISKNGADMDVSQLASGEISLLLLVAEIARRLTIANPGLEHPLMGEGIILIDEIELHLHPRWQRAVIPCLTKTFPNIQFIVTTHSPLVLSNVENESILMLENGKLVPQTPKTKGKDTNSILWDLMGVRERSSDMQNQLRVLFQLIDDDEFEKAKENLDRLRQELGENDSEIVRANTLIEIMGN